MYTSVFGVLSVLWLPLILYSRNTFRNKISLNKIIAYDCDSEYDVTDCINPYIHSGGSLSPSNHGFTQIKIDFSLNNIIFSTVLNQYDSFNILSLLYEKFFLGDSWIHSAYITDKENNDISDVTDEILKFAGPNGDFFNFDFDTSFLFPNYEPGFKLKIITNDICHTALHESLHEIDIHSNTVSDENSTLKNYGLNLLKKPFSSNSFECI